MRKEKDFIGEKEIADDALYGIQSLRAKENFPDITRFNIEWYKAIGLVKKASYLTYKSFKKAANEKYSSFQLPASSFQLIDNNIIEHLISSAEEVSEGKYFEHFIVPAISGGAGTSINMNINEIITNATLLKLGKKPGEYDIADPIEHANIFQSTNDVIPTSLKLSVMRLLTALETSINELRANVEELETKYRNTLRIGYTQMQEAVPTSYGKLFSSYSEALSRDWWRISKCFERIKVVNLGGGAIGTGIAIPRYYIMEVCSVLKELTGYPITRSENLSDATSNLDSLVEVHAIIKTHAVNLEKIVSDIRLLASDIGGNEINIQQKQLGSTIMPGKVNPVIPEFVISSAHKIYNNDSLITSLCAQGCLELNPYLPIIGHAMIESLKLMIAMDKTIKENLLEGLTVNAEIAENKLFSSPSITTALTPYIGYKKASIIANEMRKNKIDIFDANNRLKLIDEKKLKVILQPENLLKLGYSLEDLI
jgi:aspartate ammonia-lyase